MKMSTYSSRIAGLQPVASQRITRSNLLTLRAAQMKEDKVRKFVSSFLTGISSMFAGLFAAPTQKKNSMCKYYGHVIPRGNWEGYLPKCSDCGAEINNPSQLRKAQASS